MEGGSWRRPAALSTPRVWSTFDGLKAMPDGRVPRFWVQDVCPEDVDAALAIMKEHFLREEETCRSSQLLRDPQSVADNEHIWRDLLGRGAALAAWTNWPAGQPRLVAVNITAVETRGDPKPQVSGSAAKRVFAALEALSSQVDVYERFGVDRYLTAMGMSALPEFRGQGLGLQLLRAREPLCRALGLRVTVTIFTGIASQKQAQRAGFKVMAEIRYEDYRVDGKVVFPGTTAEAMQLSSLEYPPQANATD